MGNRLTVERESGERVEVSARWIVDATGRHAMLAPQARRRHAHRVASDLRDLGALQRRQGHGRPRSRGDRSLRPVRARRARLPPPRDEPLHRLGLLDLVHPPEGRRDERRARLGQAARPAGGTDASRKADGVFSTATRSRASSSSTRRRSTATAAPTGTCPTSSTSSSARDGPCVGDAGGFLDPFYSPGLDQMAFSVYTRTELMLKALSGAAPGRDGEGVRAPQQALQALTSSTSTSPSTRTSTTSWATTTP